MYKKLLSYALILSLIAPDIGRCMESDGPPVQRRQSLPSQLKKSFPETKKTRSRSFGEANRELSPFTPQFHRSLISPQKFPLIEENSEEQQQNHQDFSSPLNLTELVQECLVEEKGSGAVLQPLLQNDDQENSNIEPNIVLPGTKLEKSPPEEKNEGDHSHSPPSDYTHSSPSSSPNKNSPNHSAETEESEVTLTHSSSFDSPRDDNLTQKKDDKDLVPTLIDNNSQGEKVRQEVMDVNSSQPYSSNPVLILPEEPLTQPSTDVHKNDEKPNLSQQPSIIAITSETDLSEPLSSTEVSPRGQGSISRRSSMDSSDSESHQEMNTQGTSLAEATLLQKISSQEKPQRKLSDSSSGNETLQNLKSDTDLLPETLNSSQNSLEKQEQKQTSESDKERRNFNFIGTWKEDSKKGKKPHLQGGNIQDGGSRAVDPELGSNVKDVKEGTIPDEKTRLFPGKRPLLNIPSKSSGLKEDWQKVGSDSDSLQFRNEHGDPNFSDDEIKIGNQNGKAQRLVQEIGDGWVDLGSKGNSKGIFELHSFNGDGERPQPFSINGGDERILFEEDGQKPLQKLVPDFLKFSPNLIQNEAVLNVQIPLEGEDDEEPLRPRQSKLDQLLNELPPEAKTDLREIVNFWEKGVAMLVGAGIGAYTAYGTSILYDASMFTLATKFDHQFMKFLYGGYLVNYITISTAFDGISRNALYGKNLLTYCSRRVVDIKDAAFYGTISILPSLLTPFALISAEFDFINFFNDPQYYLLVIKQMKTGAPILFLNDWAFNINMTSEIRTNVTKWAEKSDSRFARLLSGRIFYTSPPSEEEMRKRRLSKKLEILIHKLSSLPDEKVREIYDTLQSAKTTITAELPELENLEAGVKFLTFRYVLSLSHEMEKALPEESQENDINIDELKQEQKLEISGEFEDNIQSLSSASLLAVDEKEKSKSRKKDWYEIYDKITDILIGSSLTIGSPARLITMMYVVQETLKTLMHNSAEVVLNGSAKISSGIFASLTGFPIQTGFEYKGMKNFAKMVWSREDHGHESYGWTRKAIKLACVGQGFVLAVPALVLGLQACTDLFGEDWLRDPDFSPYKWMTLISIFNYFFAEWAVQTTIAEEFWNKIFLTGAIDGGNKYMAPAYNQYVLPTLNKHIQPLVSHYIAPLKSAEPNRVYQQDWLIRFFEEQQEEMNYLHPQIHFELEKLL